MAYSEEEKEKKFNEVCQRITDGEALRTILRAGNDIFGVELFYEILDSDPVKAKQYARACEARTEIMAEQILIISDATSDDIIKDEQGNEIVNHNVIQRDRLRVDARKWLISKMNPKKYGDKIETAHSGSVGLTWNEVKNYEPNDQADQSS